MGILQRVRRRLETWGLSSDARQVRADRLTYLSIERLRRLERFSRMAVQGTRNGDVLEFGVALGGSAILLAKQARAAGRTFAGYDVFAMIPPPNSEKDGDKAKERYEVIASGQSRGLGQDAYYGYRPDLFRDVSDAMARHGVPVDGERVRLVKGLFEETWPSHGSPAVAFAHIDCDWYEPVRFCLGAVADRLQPGGVMLLDDYNDYDGCRSATDEFLAERPDFELVPGENVALRRRPTAAPV